MSLEAVDYDPFGPGPGTQIPPELQAQRDTERLRILESERAQTPENDPAASAIDTEIRDTQQKLKPDAGLEPVEGNPFAQGSDQAAIIDAARRAMAFGEQQAIDVGRAAATPAEPGRHDIPTGDVLIRAAKAAGLRAEEYAGLPMAGFGLMIDKLNESFRSLGLPLAETDYAATEFARMSRLGKSAELQAPQSDEQFANPVQEGVFRGVEGLGKLAPAFIEGAPLGGTFRATTEAVVPAVNALRELASGPVANVIREAGPNVLTAVPAATQTAAERYKQLIDSGEPPERAAYLAAGTGIETLGMMAVPLSAGGSLPSRVAQGAGASAALAAGGTAAENLAIDATGANPSLKQNPFDVANLIAAAVPGAAFGAMGHGARPTRPVEDPAQTAKPILEAGSVDDAIAAAERAINAPIESEIPASRAPETEPPTLTDEPPPTETPPLAPDELPGARIAAAADEAIARRAQNDRAAELAQPIEPDEALKAAIQPEAEKPLRSQAQIVQERLDAEDRARNAQAVRQQIESGEGAIQVPGGPEKAPAARDVTQMTDKELDLASKLTRSEDRRAELTGEILRRKSKPAEPQGLIVPESGRVVPTEDTNALKVSAGEGDAIQERGAEALPVRNESQGGEGVRLENAQGQDAAGARGDRGPAPQEAVAATPSPFEDFTTPKGEVKSFRTQKLAQAFIKQNPKVPRNYAPRKDETGQWVLSRPAPSEAQAAARRASAQRLRSLARNVRPDDDLATLLRKSGGIDASELTRDGADPKSVAASLKFGAARKSGGLSLDGAAEVMAQHGYDVYDEHGAIDATKARDLIQNVLDGEKVYTPEGMEMRVARETEQQRIHAPTDDELSLAGFEPDEINTQTKEQAALVTRLVMRDEGMAERLAIQYEGDDVGYYRAVREYLDDAENQDHEAVAGGEARGEAPARAAEAAAAEPAPVSRDEALARVKAAAETIRNGKGREEVGRGATALDEARRAAERAGAGQHEIMQAISNSLPQRPMGPERLAQVLEAEHRRKAPSEQTTEAPADAGVSHSGEAPASWVIRERATCTVIAETIDSKKFAAHNTQKYEAVPIQEHLASLNRKEAPPIELKGETEAEIKAREAQQAKEAETKKRQENAPGPEDFTLTGSDRPADVAEAKGQKSLFARKAADEKDMIVQHNLTAENVMHAHRMGGLAVPSLAITKVTHPLHNFGEISLIGPPEMANPRGYARTKVFGGDAYSPRYPDVEYRLDKTALSKLNELLAPFREEGERPAYGSDLERARDLQALPSFKRYVESKFGQDWKMHDMIALAEEVLRDVGAQERIFQGFDDNGNRRYKAHTLENVVRELKKDLRGGESSGNVFGMGQLRTKFAPQFRTIESIKLEKNRIVTDAEFEKVKEEAEQEFFGISDALKPYYDRPIDPFRFSDTVMALIEDTAKLGFGRAAKDYGFADVPQDVRQRMYEFMTHLRNMPTEYFEGKILRSVDLSEFAAAVVPHDTAPKVRDVLQKRGLAVVEYQRGDQGSRATAIRKAANERNVLFRRGPDAKGGLTLDEFHASLSDAFGKKAADRMIGKVIVPLESQAELPDHVVPFVREGDTIFGFYDPKTDKTYAVLENLSPEMVRGLAMHEVGVHYGFEKMLGEKRYGQVMRQLDAMAKAGNKDVQEARASAEREAADPSQVGEETLAYLVQNRPEMSFVKRVVSEIKAFLFREFGMGKLTPDDMATLARASVMRAAKGEGPRMFTEPAFSRKGRPEEVLDREAEDPKSPVAKVAERGKQLIGKVKNLHGFVDELNPLGSLQNKDEYLIRRYRTLGKLAKIDEATHSLYAAFRNAGDEAPNIYRYLTTKDASPEIIRDPKMRSDAERAKSMLIKVGENLVARGLLPAEVFEANKGEYLPRIYLRHLLDDEAINVLSSGKKPSTMGYLKARKDIPEDVRKFILGEITDPAYLVSKAYGTQARDIALLDWLREISTEKAWVMPDSLVKWEGRDVTPFWLKASAKRIRAQLVHYAEADQVPARAIADKMDAVADKALAEHEGAPEGWKQIPDTPRYGQLRGMIVAKEIYNDIVGQARVNPNDASIAERILGNGGTATKFTQLWKWAKVAANPPAQIRNFLSNGIMLNLSGVPMHMVIPRVVQAIREIRTNGKYWQIAKKYGVTESTFSAQELFRIEREFLDLQARHADPLSFARAKSLAGRLMDWTGDVYQLSEAIFKTAKIIDDMKRGMGEEAAILNAQKWLFDYSLVTPSMRYLRNAPVGTPFITFYFKALPRMLEVATHHPLRFAPYLAIPYVLNALIAQMQDVTQDDVKKLREALPNWLREKNNALILPMKDEKGRWVAMDYGYFLPWSMWQDLATDLSQGKFGQSMQDAGIFGGPLPDLIAAVKTNKDPFSGKEIINEYDPPAKQIASVMGYLYDMAMPTWLTSYGFGQHLYKSLNNTVDKYGKPTETAGQATMRLFGVNLYPINPEQTRAQNIKRMEFEVTQEKRRRSVALRDRTLSPEERRDIVRQYAKLIMDRQKQLRDYARASEVNPRLRTGP